MTVHDPEDQKTSLKLLQRWRFLHFKIRTEQKPWKRGRIEFEQGKGKNRMKLDKLQPKFAIHEQQSQIKLNYKDLNAGNN